MAGERRFSTGVRVLVAAGLVAVGIAVGLVLGGRGGSPAPAPSPTAGAAGTVPATSGPVTPDPGLPTLDFSDLAWADFHGLALPVSPTAGPHTQVDDRVSGFAHTPWVQPSPRSTSLFVRTPLSAPTSSNPPSPSRPPVLTSPPCWNRPARPRPSKPFPPG
ncbi:hypothetical protein [Candidatus Protofrankia californiensis]|uniref:hypothetical protein n=1 Tax=Candidatus Protofrankia californiensis TaxID=1839754 RepID=UPI001040E106|nr:hypothetical protein [Candidatus Protofrankia californiensis]